MPPTKPHTTGEIAKSLDRAELAGKGKTKITGLATDSREVESGDLFACIPGERYDGHHFALDALTAKATALLCERSLPQLDCEQIIVPSVRSALARVSELLWGLPSREMTTIGVTGTGGKTTTCFYLEKILASDGCPTVLSTTVGRRIGSGELEYTGRTTPEIPSLQRFLRRAVDEGTSYAVLEISSHGLSLGRVEGLWLDGAVFTNLARDHLDLHRDMEGYFKAKANILRLLKSKDSFVCANLDDEYGIKMLSLAYRDFPCFGFTTTEPKKALEGHKDLSRSLSGILQAVDVRVTFGLIRARLVFQDKEEDIQLPALGLMNLYNALAAATSALALGIDLNKVVNYLADAPAPPGRTQSVYLHQPFTVLVDYAHAPDSLEALLCTVSDTLPSARRIIIVFGATGRRDVGKRPQMGETATRLADLAIITTDDPYNEDPLEIALDVASGAEQAGAKEREDYLIILDRREAIAEALGRAEHGDVVLIAGKGHEPYIITAEGKIPHKDADVAEEILREMGWGGRSIE